MTIEAFVESHDVIKQYDCLYYLYPKLWGKYKAITSSLSHPDRWSGYIKYLNNNNQVSDEIKNLPNDCGGIYIFFIHGDSLPFENYLAYIGRAQYTDNENLRNRLKTYLPESKKSNGRVKIVRLFRRWKKHLYIRYYTSTDNDFIGKNESALIRAILPPFNSELTDYKIKKPVKAFVNEIN